MPKLQLEKRETGEEAKRIHISTHPVVQEVSVSMPSVMKEPECEKASLIRTSRVSAQKIPFKPPSRAYYRKKAVSLPHLPRYETQNPGCRWNENDSTACCGQQTKMHEIRVSAAGVTLRFGPTRSLPFPCGRQITSIFRQAVPSLTCYSSRGKSPPVVATSDDKRGLQPGGQTQIIGMN